MSAPPLPLRPEYALTDKLKQQQKQKQRRQQVSEEILQTEKSYVSSLQILDQVYITPLRESLTAKKIILPKELQDKLFSNIGELIKCHTQFLTEMIASLKANDEEFSGEEFLAFSPHFQLYTTYINNHSAATALIEEIHSNAKKYKRFHKFADMAENNPVCGGLTLPSFLIMPIQRIPRYRLLLSELIKRADEGATHRAALAKALETVEEVANSINEAIRARENNEAVVALQKRLDDSDIEIQLIDPNRHLLHQATIKVAPGSPQWPQLNADVIDALPETDLLLFNDTLIESSTSKSKITKLLRQIPLNENILVEPLMHHARIPEAKYESERSISRKKERPKEKEKDTASNASGKDSRANSEFIAPPSPSPEGSPSPMRMGSLQGLISTGLSSPSPLRGVSSRSSITMAYKDFWLLVIHVFKPPPGGPQATPWRTNLPGFSDADPAHSVPTVVGEDMKRTVAPFAAVKHLVRRRPRELVVFSRSENECDSYFKAFVKALDPWKDLVLSRCCQQGVVPLCQQLIKAKANVDFLENGWTPLMYASYHNHIQILPVLIENHAQLNAVDEAEGCTALIIASQLGHKEVMDTLLKAGCDITIKNKANQTAFDVGSKEIYESVEEVKDPAFVSSVLMGHTQLFTYLLKCFVNLTYQDKDGLTALHHSVRLGHSDFITAILNTRSHTKPAHYLVPLDNMGLSALQHAVLIGNIAVLTQLIQAGASVNNHDNQARTALHQAALSNRLDMVELLIASHCDVDPTDVSGRSALHHAASVGNLEIVKRLMSAGVSHNVKDKSGALPETLGASFPAVKAHFDFIREEERKAEEARRKAEEEARRKKEEEEAKRKRSVEEHKRDDLRKKKQAEQEQAKKEQQRIQQEHLDRAAASAAAAAAAAAKEGAATPPPPVKSKSFRSKAKEVGANAKEKCIVM